jgi:hypothetical protein
MSTPRRDFLGWLGGSALFASAGLPLRVPHPSAGDTLKPIAADYDMSWLDRLKGSHRAVFDSPGIGEGAALFRAVVWKRQYKQVYGTDPADMTAVLVLRHEGIVLAMDDAFWAEFEVGKENKVKDPDGKKWTKTNPILTLPPDAPPQWAAFTLAKFQEDGGIVLACNMAFGDVVDRYKTKGKLSAEDARKVALTHLAPGVILQPSGVFAALRAQEAGCQYIIAG